MDDGLKTNEQTFAIKAGAQQYAAQHGLMIVTPDTSPRNTGVTGAEPVPDVTVAAGIAGGRVCGGGPAAGTAAARRL